MQGHKQLLLGTAFNILKCGSDIFEVTTNQLWVNQFTEKQKKGELFLIISG